MSGKDYKNAPAPINTAKKSQQSSHSKSEGHLSFTPNNKWRNSFVLTCLNNNPKSLSRSSAIKNMLDLLRDKAGKDYTKLKDEKFLGAFYTFLQELPEVPKETTTPISPG